jgi:hypothetical protein
MNDILLYNKFYSLPANVKTEVEKFIDNLMNKNKRPTKHKPRFGSAKGMFGMKKFFDESIEDFKEYQ